MLLQTTETIGPLLNSLLPIEWTVAALYQRNASLLARLGIAKLADKFEEESLEERGHARLLLDRLAFLGVRPEPLTTPARTLENVPDHSTPGDPLGALPTAPLLMLTTSLALESDAAAQYRRAISSADEAGDHGTRLVLEQILRETEQHVWWLEQQLNRATLIGRENFLTEWS